MTTATSDATVESAEPQSSPAPPVAGRSLTRQLAGQSAVMMMGNAFTLVVGFPFQIYLARMLGADSLGAFGVFDITVQTTCALFGFGLGDVVVRFLPQYLADGQSQHIRKLLRTVFGIAALASLCGVAVFLVGGPYLIQWSENILVYRNVMTLMSFMIPLGMFLGMSQQVLRGFFDIRYIVLMSSVLQLTLKIGLSVLFLWQGLQLMGYVLAVIISSAISLAGMWIGIYRHVGSLPKNFGTDVSSERAAWIEYGKVMYGNSLIGIIFAPLERVLLASVIDLKAVGVLMVIRQLQTFPQIFLQVIIAVVAPMFVAAKKLEEVAHLYHLATDWLCRLAFPLIIFFLLRSNAILALYGADFAALGNVALIVILLTQCVNLGCGPIGNLLNMRGREKVMFRINVISIGLMLVGTVALVPSLGLLGAAIATAMSTVTANFWALWVTHRTLSIRWASQRYLRWVFPVIVASSVLVFLGFVTGGSKWWLCFEFATCVGVFHLTYYLGGMCDDDREVISMVTHRLFKKHSATTPA